MSIEHDKPLETRTYEQTAMLDAYLYFHFGDLSPLSYIETNKTQTESDPVSSNWTITSHGTKDTPNANFGEFGYFNSTNQAIEAPYGGNFIANIPNFPKQVADMAIHWYKQVNKDTSPSSLNAIDIGCSVGRTCFELATFFPKVTGLDFSHLFVNTAAALAKGDVMDYSIPIEGEHKFDTKYQYNPIANTTLDFIQGDACALDKTIKYNCITGANLIDRLPNPMSFLTTLPTIVEHNGIVVFTSPYTWLEQYTPKEKWLPNLALDKETGLEVKGPNGETLPPTQKTTFEALYTIMSPNFKLIHHSHLPFFIHETARKAQYSLAHCTVWVRK